ncbi:MAG: threonine/serine exporter family protein [Micropruina sp.]|nr:threonine/serine exporter family protein [Micropruina sp.]
MIRTGRVRQRVPHPASTGDERPTRRWLRRGIATCAAAVLLAVPVGVVGWSDGPALAAPVETQTPAPQAPEQSTVPPSEPEPEPTVTSEPPKTTAPPATTEPPAPVPTTASPTPTTPTTPAAGPTATRSPGAPVTLPAVPPVYTADHGSPVSWMIAALALAVGVVAGFVLRRRSVRAARAAPVPARTFTTDAAVPGLTGSQAPRGIFVEDAADKLHALESAGQAMIDAGYSVAAVRQALEEIAEASGYPETEVVVFPTALFVSARGLGEVRTGAVTSGASRLNLAQVDALDDVITQARSGGLDAATVMARIDGVRALPPPYSTGRRVLAYGAASAGIAVLLGSSLLGTALAAALGMLVGWALTRTENVPQQYQALVTVASAFVVGLVVLLVVRGGYDPGVLPSLIAPLVTFLPGALLTTGVVELSTGHMMAGAGRLASGAMQLVLLAAGVTAAAALVGLPSLELVGAEQPLGPLAPWLAVAVFGVGIVIHSNGRPGAIGWVLLVLYVAYGAQVLADIAVGGVLSAFIGALAMTPVAVLVAQQPSGPAAFVSFLPAFWLLVPGALGLVGVTSLLDGNSAGLSALLTTASTMVAIALGILTGSALGDRLAPTRRALI